MKTELQTQQLAPEVISNLILNGDLSKLTQIQKVQYYTTYCSRLGLDPATQPFKLLKLNGREVLYCDRSGTQQLSNKNKVSHAISAREIVNECYVVTAKASTPDGRSTESIGAVNISGYKGDMLCNAMMKAETKAKRRATLDLLGLGILDESEIETIPNAKSIAIDVEHKEVESNTEELKALQSEYTKIIYANDHVLGEGESKTFLEGYQTWSATKLQKAIEKIKDLFKRREDEMLQLQNQNK